MGTRRILDKSRWKAQGREKKILFWGGYCSFIEAIGGIINVKWTHSIM